MKYEIGKYYTTTGYHRTMFKIIGQVESENYGTVFIQEGLGGYIGWVNQEMSEATSEIPKEKWVEAFGDHRVFLEKLKRDGRKPKPKSKSRRRKK